MRRLRSGLTYTNVVATLALFLALSGGAVYAANKITSKQIGKGAVKNKNLAKNAVKNKNLAKNAVTSPKLAKNAVKNAECRRRRGQLRENWRRDGRRSPVRQRGRFRPARMGPVPLNPPLTVTPVAGQLLTLHFESRGALTATQRENAVRGRSVPGRERKPNGIAESCSCWSRRGALPGPFGTAASQAAGSRSRSG